MLASCSKVICPEPISHKPDKTKKKVEDACVSLLQSDKNYGAIHYNWAGCWDYSTTIDLVEFYIWFDYSHIPFNAQITSAKINLFANDTIIFEPEVGHYSNNPSTNMCRLSKVKSNWEESTITWSNKPSISSTEFVILNASTSNTQNYLDIDVTSIVREQHPNENYGFCVRLVNPNSYDNRMIFHSSESFYTNLHPSIDISYQSSP